MKDARDRGRQMAARIVSLLPMGRAAPLFSERGSSSLSLSLSSVSLVSSLSLSHSSLILLPQHYIGNYRQLSIHRYSLTRWISLKSLSSLPHNNLRLTIGVLKKRKSNSASHRLFPANLVSSSDLLVSISVIQTSQIFRRPQTLPSRFQPLVISATLHWSNWWLISSPS